MFLYNEKNIIKAKTCAERRNSLWQITINHSLYDFHLEIIYEVTKNKIRIAGMHLLFPSVGDVSTGNEETGAYIFTATCADQMLF